MKIYDLTPGELHALLKVGKSIGIHSVRDLFEIVRRHKIRDGSHLLNFVYAATVMPWLLTEVA